MFLYEIEANLMEPKDVFECGQCFRWNLTQNNTYTGIFKNCVVEVKKNNNKIIFEGENVENDYELFKKNINYYFDLDRDYKKIRKQLSQIDDYLNQSIKFGKGIRILNQDLFETIISFIISANNNIPRIKGIIEKICKNYGNKITYKEKEYFTFPSIESLSKASVEDLRKLGLGFRDKRVFDTCKMIKNKEIDLNQLEKLETHELRDVILKLPGVGDKVCDCILLFSTLKRFDVFPIDVWVRRVMNELYIHNIDESKVNKEEIQKIANEKFGNLQGIAQQYLFYWKRSA